MRRIKNCLLKTLMLKLDFRNDKQLHDAIIVKLLNLGFTKKGCCALNTKKGFMVFIEDGKFYEAHSNWVYAHKYTLINLDDLYDLTRLIPPDTSITLASGKRIELSEESYNKLLEQP